MQDAMMLVAHNYDTYKVENREKEREEIARKAAKMADEVLVREPDREPHPVSVLTTITLLSENRYEVERTCWRGSVIHTLPKTAVKTADYNLLHFEYVIFHGLFLWILQCLKDTLCLPQKVCDSRGTWQFHVLPKRQKNSFAKKNWGTPDK